MDGSDFEDLLTGDLGSEVRWQPSMPCPCTLDSGAADQRCAVCKGKGITWGELSKPFMVGLVSADAKNRAALAQYMGPGMLGGSTLVIPCSALCYDDITAGDRIFDQSVTDTRQMILLPGTIEALPVGFTALTAYVKAPDGIRLVKVAPPVATLERKVSVSVPTTLIFRSPRGYEAVRELGHVRSFGLGLPKRWGVNLIETSTR